jgi:drug/metabolite transporter (DMT)-like permease
MAIVLAGFSALLYGIADFSGGYAATKSRLLSVLILSQLVGTVVALIALVLLGSSGPTFRDLAWGFVAGFSGSMGLFMLYGGIARSIVAIVSPASALVGALIPVLFGLALGERPSHAAIAGSVLCLPAILLLSWEGRDAEHQKGSVRSALFYGILAGLGFGVFFVTLSRSNPGAGVWPLLGARMASITSFALALLVSREPFRVEREGRVPSVVAGAADMGANILFLLASQSGMLSLVAIITSLFPAPTVILARFVFHQRIPPARMAGLTLALLGVALISLR